MNATLSADASHRARVRDFLARHAKRCGCPLEIRQERGLLVCARCDAPLLPKDPTP
jgi:hypothetical protein